MRSVSVPCGVHCPDRVTLLQANAAAGLGHLGSCATSAWTGMCVDQLGSSVRLTHCFLRSNLHILFIIPFSFSLLLSAVWSVCRFKMLV